MEIAPIPVTSMRLRLDSEPLEGERLGAIEYQTPHGSGIFFVLVKTESEPPEASPLCPVKFRQNRLPETGWRVIFQPEGITPAERPVFSLSDEEMSALLERFQITIPAPSPVTASTPAPPEDDRPPF